MIIDSLIIYQEVILYIDEYILPLDKSKHELIKIL